MKGFVASKGFASGWGIIIVFVFVFGAILWGLWPKGKTFEQVTGLLKEVIKARNIVGADIVELSPIPGQQASDFLAARLAYKIITHLSQKV